MSKTKKILYLILCILILTILIPILLDYHKVSGLGLHLVDWNQNSFFRIFIFQDIFFWGALVLSAVVWFLMLVTLFYPKQYLEIQLPDVDGNLN